MTTFIPLCQGRSCILKRLANRGRQNKQRRGNRFGSDRCNRLKSCSWHWLHRKGPIDLEKKYKLEQGTILNWTDPTLPSTAPEKFLDIFYYYHFFIFKFFITPFIFIFKTNYYLGKKTLFLKQISYMLFIIFVILFFLILYFWDFNLYSWFLIFAFWYLLSILYL